VYLRKNVTFTAARSALVRLFYTFFEIGEQIVNKKLLKRKKTIIKMNASAA